ncbi:hypothetical protein DPMN_045366 [Dreissena polymorpha]|uniref:Uncharacterized protein n=1 Tax=Dreissena polymorpha TaxID=45954 RepID=A0A9D4D637_DREPO|nr:hypothetical protein DPMN_045366 [Dreissena polymorpha]
MNGGTHPYGMEGQLTTEGKCLAGSRELAEETVRIGGSSTEDDWIKPCLRLNMKRRSRKYQIHMYI